MKISTENIEEWMFDFHEGTLSEADKSELLNFLHNHPEYNEDFSRWTQTHALKNEPIPLPSNLLEGVLQPTPIPFYGHKFLLGTATGIALSAILAGYLWFSKAPDPSLQKTAIQDDSPKETTQMPLTAPNPSQTKPMAKPSKYKSDFPKTKTSLHPTLIDSSFEEKAPEQATLLALDTASYASPDTVASPEQAASTPVATHNEETATSASKKKRKSSPLNIKPQSKFKPANPNF